MRRSASTLFRRGVAAACAGVAVVSGHAAAQPIVVSPGIRMSPGTEEWNECSVGVSQTNKNDVLVMAIRRPVREHPEDPPPPLGQLGYVSVMWGSGAPVVGSVDLGKIDPYLAPHPSDGSVWFAALDAAYGHTIVGWKDAGASTIPADHTEPITPHAFEDKPGMAIGPSAGAPGEQRSYVVRVSLAQPCAQHYQEQVSYTDDPGSDWFTTMFPLESKSEPDHLCDYLGLGAAPVVLDNTRIVVAIRDVFAGVWRYNEGKPYVVYSDDGGYDWEPDEIDNPIRIAPGDLANATNWLENCANVCPNTTCLPVDPTGAACADCGDTPMQIDRRGCMPAIAADHEPEPDHVYVAFYARSAAASTNTDIIIHRSVDGGETFDPSIQDNPDFLHLTDALLGLTAGTHDPDQLVPAIAVDACGGVNVMFYDNRHDPDPDDCEIWYDVYYARITNFGPTPTVAQWRLTPQSFRVDNLGGPEMLGHYHHMTVSADGTTLYLASIARNMGDPEEGARTCSLHRVNLNCLGAGPADFTGDGEVNGADMEGYLAAFAGGEAAADVDLDWTVGLDDFITYAEWYVERE